MADVIPPASREDGGLNVDRHPIVAWGGLRADGFILDHLLLNATSNTNNTIVNFIRRSQRQHRTEDRCDNC